MSARHGGRLLVDQLVLHGVDTVFTVPGESVLGLLEGLSANHIRVVVARHEGSAAFMAVARRWFSLACGSRNSRGRHPSAKRGVALSISWRGCRMRTCSRR